MKKQPIAENFMASAESDLLVIRHELATKDTAWAMVAYHAQQAGEKYLKAFLIRNGEAALRTHDLGGLLKFCLRFDASLALLNDDCETLTEFATGARYEEFTVYNTEPIARRAVAAAERVCNAIRERMLKE